MASSSARRTGSWKGRIAAARPMRTRRVRIAAAAASTAGETERPYSIKWCSVSQMLSKPSSSVQAICSSSRRNTSPCVSDGGAWRK